MGWGSSIFPLLIVTSSGGFTGFFLYAPTVGTGNLFASISPHGGTDPFGNAYLPGIVTYTNSGGTFYAFQITGINIQVSSAASAAGPYTLPLGQLQFVPGLGWELTGLASNGVALTINGGISQPTLQLITDAATTEAINIQVIGDAHNRFQARGDGLLNWGPGSASADSSMSRGGANLLNASTCDLAVHTAGRGLRVAEGANAKQGLTGAMVAGTLLVANTAITANSRLLLTRQAGGTNPGAVYESARVAGTSFTVTSTNAADTGQVAFEIFEPG